MIATSHFSEQCQQITPESPAEPPAESSTQAIEPLGRSLQQPNERHLQVSPLSALAALQASQPADKPAWESQMMINRPENSIMQPLAFSSAATEAASVKENCLKGHEFRNFKGLDWRRLKRSVALLSTLQGQTSWIFKSWLSCLEGGYPSSKGAVFCVQILS